MKRREINYSPGDEVFRCVSCGRFLSVEKKVNKKNTCLRCYKNYMKLNRDLGITKTPKLALSHDQMLYVYGRCRELEKDAGLVFYARDMGVEKEEIPATMLIHIIDHVKKYKPGYKYPRSYYTRLMYNFLSNCRQKKRRYVENDYVNKIRLSVYNVF